MNRKRFLCSIVVIVCLLFGAIGCSGNHDTITSDTEIVVHYLSVGQADAAIIECGDHYAMIDCGNDSIIENGFSKMKVDLYLQQENIEKFDYIFCSHYDVDHYGGFGDILKNREVGSVYGPSGSELISTHEMVAFNNVLSEQNKEIMVPDKGEKFNLGSAEIEVLAVDEGNSKNDTSLVLMVTYKNTKFLFTGDAERTTERELVKSGENLSCDVLKVAHHGSSTSTSESFLASVRPTYAILSVAANRNLPDSTVLDYLEDVGAQVYRTDEEGTIICHSNGNTITIKNADGEQIN